jgi:hypothetical protein
MARECLLMQHKPRLVANCTTYSLSWLPGVQLPPRSLSPPRRRIMTSRYTDIKAILLLALGALALFSQPANAAILLQYR